MHYDILLVKKICSLKKSYNYQIKKQLKDVKRVVIKFKNDNESLIAKKHQEIIAFRRLKRTLWRKHDETFHQILQIIAN